MVFTDRDKVGGVSILLLFVLRQDILDLKAWGDHIESDHLTILVKVVIVGSVGTRPIQL